MEHTTSRADPHSAKAGDNSIQSLEGSRYVQRDRFVKTIQPEEPGQLSQ